MNYMPQIEAISKYVYFRDDLLNCIKALSHVERVREFPWQELREKLINNTFNLVVVGQFKRGKSSLINALLGANILPVGVVPLTSIVTIITYGETLKIKVYFNDGRINEIKQESLWEYVTEKGNPKNIKDVREVILTYPSPYLKDGVRLIDTPGVDSVYQHNTDVAYQYLPKSDAALFLLSADQPMSRAEIDFLNDVKEYSNKIFFLFNKADYLNKTDLMESIDFSKNVLKEVIGIETKIFPVSAKLALEGILSNSEDMVQNSFLPQFFQVLHTFLMEEKGKILIHSVTNNLLRIISQTKFELELEFKSLTTSLNELKKKINVLKAKKQEVMLEKQDFEILLDGEMKRILKNILERDLEKFKEKLIKQVTAHVESYFIKNRKLSLKNLNDALEHQIITEVRRMFNTWRTEEDNKLAGEFESVSKRLIMKINDTIDGLLKFSSELFAIPFVAIKAEALWSVKSNFYYKFYDEPFGLEKLISSLTFALPKYFADKIILKKMKEYLCEVIDMQSGRVRYDFAERLEKSKEEFKADMLQKIESTIEGIEAAIKKGMSQRSSGEIEVERSNQTITEMLQELEEINGRLINIKECAEGTK